MIRIYLGNKCKSCVNIDKMELDYKPNIYFILFNYQFVPLNFCNKVGKRPRLLVIEVISPNIEPLRLTKHDICETAVQPYLYQLPMQEVLLHD